MGMRSRLTWNGDAVTARQEAGARQGLQRAAEHLLGVSRQRVPLEEGTLSRSGRAEQTGLKAHVSYGTVYARRQHEELTWRHDPGRTAKYLEGPLTEESGTLTRIIGQSIRDSLS